MMNTPNCYLAQAGAEEANHKIDERTPSNQSRSSFGFVPFFKQNCISLYHPHEPIRALFEELLKEVVSQEKIALIVESLYKYCPKTLLSLAFVLPSFFSLDHPMIKRLEDMLQRYRLSANTFDQAAAYLALVMIEKTAQEEFPVDVEKFALPFANKDLFEEDVKIPSPF
ncbi:MAG: hypothetical protein FJZ56_07715, partial [Chlamydiae bacterium]|nr:hypothetical protein [Chlamydiota bacterium]